MIWENICKKKVRRKMNKIHQICPVCAACNTTEKDGYYMCCGCRHKWKDVKSSSVFDHITQSVETLAEKVVYAVYYGGLYFWHSTLIYPSFPFETREAAITATVEEIKKEYKK
jgi:hypothetical protein